MVKLLRVAVFFACAGWALGQTQEPSGFGPCSSKTPDGLPCSDPNFGVVVRFSGPIPTERLSLPAPTPTGPPVVIPPADAQPVTPPGARNDFQYWSYQANGEADYHDGTTVVHVDSGTLQNYASSPSRFQESYQAGEAMGSGIGALMAAWIAHHQRGVEKRNEGIRQQIGRYVAATHDLAEEVVRDEEASLVDYAFLAKVKPSYRTAYEEDAKDVSDNRADLAALGPMCERALSNVRATEDTKKLRTYLGIIEKAYQDLRDRAEEDYAFSRSVAGLAGYFASQQAAQSASAHEPANPQ